MKFIVASHNQNKVDELSQLFHFRGADCKSYRDLVGHVKFPVEGCHSYRENAKQKALFISEKLPDHLVVADDSGLELAAKPLLLGVKTARDLAEYHTPHEYDQYIIRLVKNQSRDFKMQTTIACAYQNQVIACVDGILTGQVAKTERGQGGAGFNQILIPEHSQRTLAELPFTERYYYLSRARAVDELLWQLKDNHNNR